MINPALFKNKWALAGMFVCCLLLIFEIFFILNQPWMGDYWEHKAVIHEIAVHPFQPSHPIINAHLPHAFYSPYLVGLGMIVYYTGISVNQVLNAAIIINLFLFFFAVWILVKLFLKKEEPAWKAFTLLLLAILFFNGWDMPNFSSFFHFRTFLLILSYPSTVSFLFSIFAAALFQFCINTREKRSKRILAALLAVLLLWVALLAHPVTYLLAGALFIVVLIQKQQEAEFFFNPSFFYNGFIAAVLLLLPFAFAFVWPYYPFYSLITYVSPGNQFHADSRELYSNLYFKLYPFLILLFIVRKNFLEYTKANFSIIAALIFLSFFFVYGFISGSYGFGRVISFITILATVFLLQYILLTYSFKKQTAILLTMFLICTPFIYASFISNFILAGTSHQQYLSAPIRVPYQNTPPAEKVHRTMFLQNYLHQNDIVMADSNVTALLPSIGAKVMGSFYPAYWIADNKERIAAIKQFYSAFTTAEQRSVIIKKYGVHYIVLNPANDGLLPVLQPLIDSSFRVSQNGITLLQVKKNL
ncbi:MAG: hypothetical protein K2X48_08580 [Chitinophagaceae bacterium]|nr:hypothetical protein [Chitinophagaceae bacterium]